MAKTISNDEKHRHLSSVEFLFLDAISLQLPTSAESLIKYAIDFDLQMSNKLKLDSFLLPLQTRRFPTNHLYEFRWILSESMDLVLKTVLDKSPECALYLSALNMNCELTLRQKHGTGSYGFPRTLGVLCRAASRCSADLRSLASMYVDAMINQSQFENQTDSTLKRGVLVTSIMLNSLKTIDLIETLDSTNATSPATEYLLDANIEGQLWIDNLDDIHKTNVKLNTFRDRFLKQIKGNF